MKQFIALTMTILLTSMALAADVTPTPAAAPTPLCRDQAIKAAEALFAINNKTSEIKSTTELVDLDHAAEGGYEVWDVNIESKGVKHAPYRMTTLINGCTVIDFEMPFAG